MLRCGHALATRDASGWVDAPVAIDILRAMRVERCGYRTWTQTITDSITRKN